MNRTLLKYLLGLALALFLKCDVSCANGFRGSASAAITSRVGEGDGDPKESGDIYKNSGSNKSYLSNNKSGRGNKHIKSSRTLYNKISSTHHIQLEYSGVTYASISLDVVKADIVDAVRHTLSKYLRDDIDVVDVKRAYIRMLRGQSQRSLSYIRLVVTVSLRHASWISTERALATIIETLGEHVDEDFRAYMKSLPGNGDYLGEVDVTSYFSDIAIQVPSTTNIPIIEPTQEASNNEQKTVGSFQFKLIFNEVSTHLSNSDALRSYMAYGITRVLEANLGSGIEVLDVSLEPGLPEVWLTFTMMISLQYPRSQKDIFIYADEILRSNTGDIDLYLDDYIATYSLSEMEKVDLESNMKEVFGEMANVEIREKTAAPTASPTKVGKPVIDWVNTRADTLESIMPWWGWVILVIASASIALCCCYFSVRLMRRKRDAQAQPTTVTNNVQVTEQDKVEPIVIKAEPVVVKHNTSQRPPASERNPMSKSMNVDGNKKATPRNLKESRLVQSMTLDPSKVLAHQILSTADPETDAALYKPSPNPEDPKRKQKKTKKKNKEKTDAPDPEERILAIEPKKSKKDKKKGKKATELDPNLCAPDPEERLVGIDPEKRRNKKIPVSCTDVVLFEPNPNAPDPD